MCKRTTTDPLVKLFVERYHVNLLPVPRRDARCGQLYVAQRRGVAAVPGRIEELLEAPVSLPPTRTDEPLGNLGGAVSKRVEARAGLDLLDGFLDVTGLGSGLVATLRAEYERKRAHTVRFRLEQTTRDSIDPLSLGTALQGRRLERDHPWIADGNRYYVTAGVVRARVLVLQVEDERATSVDLGVEALAAVGGHAGISVERRAEGEIAYQGADALAIGVELYELRFDRERRAIAMRTLDEPVDLQHGRRQVPVPAFPAGEDEVLLPLVA
jgi:hypothetical protein